MRVILAADHRGFELKNRLKEAFATDQMSGFDGTIVEALDAGATQLVANDDFPDYARTAIEYAAASNRENPAGATPSLLILICGSGQGMAMAANRFNGYRAAVVFDLEGAILSRQHNDANVLCLPARLFDAQFDKCLEIVKAWLNTRSDADERFRRRNYKLDHIREGVV
jgi:ribose 5-phosphate isomerase B